MRCPAHIIEFGTWDGVSTGDAGRCVPGQRCMAARFIVIGLKIGELLFEVTSVPEEHEVEKLPPCGPDRRRRVATGGF